MDDVATIIETMEDETSEQWTDERLKAPGLMVRVLGWLLRPIVWEAMRQHPRIDENRDIRDRMLTLRDAVSGLNRHRGYGP